MRRGRPGKARARHGPTETTTDRQGPRATERDQEAKRDPERPRETARDRERPTEAKRGHERPREAKQDREKTENKAREDRPRPNRGRAGAGTTHAAQKAHDANPAHAPSDRIQANGQKGSPPPDWPARKAKLPTDWPSQERGTETPLAWIRPTRAKKTTRAARQQAQAEGNGQTDKHTKQPNGQTVRQTK